MDPIVTGLIIVLIILAIVYVVYPIYFENYVLMNIPEYKILTETLARNEKDLSNLKAHMEKIKKLGGTEAELIRNNELILNLKRRALARGAAIRRNSVLIVELRRRLRIIGPRERHFRKLHADATRQLKELNDTMIKSFVFKDAILAKKLQGARDTLLIVLSKSKDILCSALKDGFLISLEELVTSMKGDVERTNTLCDMSSDGVLRRGLTELKNREFSQNCGRGSSGWRLTRNATTQGIYIRAPSCFNPSNGVYSHNVYGSVQPDLEQLFGNIEDLITYVITDKFCDEDLKFKIDEFEKFVKNMLNGLCESDDWKKVTGKQLDYLLQKPATYLE